MSIIVLSYLPSILGIGLLAAVTYLSNPKARINKTFTVFAAGVFLWLFSLMLADTATTDLGALWSLRAALFVGSIIGTSFIMFADSFPNENMRTISDRMIKILWFMTAISMVLSLTDYMIPSVANSETESTLESVTPAYALQTVFVLGQMFAGAYITLRRRSKVTPQQRAQIQLFGYGMMVTIFASIVPNVIFIILDVTSIWTPFLTSFSYFVLVLSMWLAITRHQLFHIRGIIARAIAYIASAFLVVSAYAYIVGRVIDSHVSSQSLGVLLIGFSFLTAILIFGKITWFFNRITNHLFYREAYSSRVALGKLTDALVSHIELSPLIKTSRSVLAQTLKPVHETIVIYGPKDRMLGDPTPQIVKTLDQVLPTRSRITPGRFISVDATTAKNAEYMRRGGIQLIVPIHTTKNLEGCIVLGPRSSGEVYSRQDLDFLKIAARNIGVAVNNAKSYQEIADFNKTLAAKVKNATKELRTINHELESLHKTKDDFIAMASHQLRPKITASQGFLELLNKSGLKTTKDQSELLDLTYQGIQRMSDIVIDMLDISRMDAEHMELDYSSSPVDFVGLVEQEIAGVGGSSNKERFKLSTQPRALDAQARVDVVKMREVVVNLLSNATQYSSKDTLVTIKVSADKDHVKVVITDKGIGLTQGEQRRLFEKFYRAQEAKKIRPTGSGVGLYMSKKVVEAHGGEMIVSSKKGTGSLIGFKLPRHL